MICMIGYRDMTFCPFFKQCKKGKKCDRALTDEVKKAAEKWWGDKHAPICMFAEKPECFEDNIDKRGKRK